MAGSGAGANLKVGAPVRSESGGGHRSCTMRQKKKFLVVPLHFFAIKAQLVALVSGVVMVSTVCPVSCLLFFYSRCPPCPAICKSGGTCPRAPWSRRHCGMTGALQGGSRNYQNGAEARDRGGPVGSRPEGELVRNRLTNVGAMLGKICGVYPGINTKGHSGHFTLEVVTCHPLIRGR